MAERTELNVESIEGDSVDHTSEVGVWEGALGSTSDVVGLRGTVEVVTELLDHGSVVSSVATLNIEIDTKDHKLGLQRRRIESGRTHQARHYRKDGCCWNHRGRGSTAGHRMTGLQHQS